MKGSKPFVNAIMSSRPIIAATPTRLKMSRSRGARLSADSSEKLWTGQRKARIEPMSSENARVSVP